MRSHLVSKLIAVAILAIGGVAHSASAQVGFEGFIRATFPNASQVPDMEIATGPWPGGLTPVGGRILGVTNDEIACFTTAGVQLFKENIHPVPGVGLGFFELDSADMADPEVLYDSYSNRYWAVIFANDIVGQDDTAGFAIAVSQGPAPEGNWNKWYFVDDDPDAIYGFDSPNISVDQTRVYVSVVCRSLDIFGNIVETHRVYSWLKSPLMGTSTPPGADPLPTTVVLNIPAATDLLMAGGLAQQYTFDGSPPYIITAYGGSNQNKIRIQALNTTTVPFVDLTVPTGFEYSAPVKVPQLGTIWSVLIFDGRFWGTPVYRAGSLWPATASRPRAGRRSTASSGTRSK